MCNGYRTKEVWVFWVYHTPTVAHPHTPCPGSGGRGIRSVEGRGLWSPLGAPCGPRPMPAVARWWVGSPIFVWWFVCFLWRFFGNQPPPPPPRKTGGGGSAINPPSDFFHEPSRLVFRTPITPIVVLAQYTIQLFLAPSKPPDTHYTHCVVFTAALKKMLQCF